MNAQRTGRSLPRSWPGNNEVDTHAHQFGCERGQFLDVVRPAKRDDDVLALDPAEIA